MTVAVAGQPNTGKSTLFNRLTGLNQRVGNWTGKTVDRKEGAALWNGVAFTFVDLPGCYGMTPHSPEEEVARDYLLSGGPDAVLAVVNAASVERSLYIVSELVALGLPVVVALNMTDVAEPGGQGCGCRCVVFGSWPARDPAGGHVGGRDRRGRVAPGARGGILPRQCARRACQGVVARGDYRGGPAVRPALGRRASCSRATRGCWPGRKPFPGRSGRRSVCCWATPRSHRSCTRPGRHGSTPHVARAVRTSGTVRGLTERWDRVLLHPLWGRLAAFLVIPAGCVLGAALGMMTGGLVLFAVLAWAPDLKAAYPGPLGSLVADALLPAFGWVVALLSMISALYAIFSFSGGHRLSRAGGVPHGFLPQRSGH